LHCTEASPGVGTTLVNQVTKAIIVTAISKRKLIRLQPNQPIQGGTDLIPYIASGNEQDIFAREWSSQQPSPLSS